MLPTTYVCMQKKTGKSMKINKNSWHYKFAFGGNNYLSKKRKEAHNVCTYVRGVAAMAAEFALFVSFLFMGTIGSASMGIYMLQQFILNGVINLENLMTINSMTQIPLTFFIAGSLVFFAGEVVVGTIAAFIWSIRTISAAVRKRLNLKLKGKKAGPSVFTQYLKDKHNKVCTLVKYE